MAPGRARRTSRDDIVVFEVMVRGLDAAWWRGYRAELEGRFPQDVVVVRPADAAALAGYRAAR